MTYWVPERTANVGSICGLLVGDGAGVAEGLSVAVRLGLGVLVEGFLVAVLSEVGVASSLDSGVFVGGRSVAVTVAEAAAGDEVTIATAEAIKVGVDLFPPLT